MEQESNALLLLATLWWLVFFTALGLCLGSFLNVVIYRLPRGRSLRNPLWSHCPHCKRRIAWYDNLPIVSFLALRGRCRRCGVPIPTIYLVIEAITALIVLMLLDAYFVGRVRAGLGLGLYGLTDRVWSDWPILTAHIVLFACLLSMSAIDLEHYWVDVRFTYFATGTAFVMHTLWTPKHSAEWIRPADATAVGVLFALAGLVLVWVLRVCLVEPSQPAVEPPYEEEEEQEDIEQSAKPTARRPPPSLASPSRAAGWIAVVLLAATFVALLLDEVNAVNLRHTGRALVPLLFFFALIVRESTVRRSADQEIAEAIDEERPQARSMVLRETAGLLPALVLGAFGVWLMNQPGELPERLAAVLHREWLAGWQPLYGLSTAAAGFIIGGALGWVVRIVFTLVFGREAFGTGDIHLLAATGCVAGWPVAVLGFFLSCVLAMAGWLLALPFKRPRALPLGPWLALSFLTVVVFYDRIIEWSLIERVTAFGRMVFFSST